MSALVITLPWPTRELWPNCHAHPLRKYPAQAQAKHDGYYATLAALTPRWTSQWSPLTVEITAHPPSLRPFDDDNLVSAFKHYRDGIALALGIDDVKFTTLPVVRGEKRKGGCIIVTIGAPPAVTAAEAHQREQEERGQLYYPQRPA